MDVFSNIVFYFVNIFGVGFKMVVVGVDEVVVKILIR